MSDKKSNSLKGAQDMKLNFEKILLIIFLIFWTALAINPNYRSVWVSENVLFVIFLFVLIFTYKKFRFSRISYFMIFLIGIFQTIGAHYSYAEVPLGFFLSELFNLGRNHYDRIIHFSFGLLLTLPAYELLTEKKLLKKNSLFTLLCIVLFAFATGAIYEILEWGYSIHFEEKIYGGVLGSQGDVWDAQKDMLLEGIGSMISCFFIYIFKFRKGSKGEK